MWDIKNAAYWIIQLIQSRVIWDKFSELINHDVWWFSLPLSLPEKITSSGTATVQILDLVTYQKDEIEPDNSFPNQDKKSG